MAQSTTTEDLLERVRALTVWTKGGERAPHKPLLLLMALAGLQQGRTALPFSEAAPKLAQLLREFGPSRRTVHPEYPFWRLQNDGLWQVTADGPMRRRIGSSDVPAAEQRAAGYEPPHVTIDKAPVH